MRYREIIRDVSNQKQSNDTVVDIEDLPLFEMANLSAERTGVTGTIFISTKMAGHAPRIKWYPGRPTGENTPCLIVTITRPVKVINKHLSDTDAKLGSGPASKWVALNFAALMNFWNNGNLWMDEEVTQFKSSLKKI